MKRFMAAAICGAFWLIGLALSAVAEGSKPLMQWYAVSLCLLSIGIIAMRVKKDSRSLLSCYSVMMLSPIWFLNLEAVFPGGDCWLLPAQHVVHTLAYGAFFLMVCNLAYCARMPRSVVGFHDRNYLRTTHPAFLPTLGIFLTILTFVVVLARYNWSWEATKDVYLAGRAGGSGLIRRGGIGGWEVFIQPLDFMCASVPTIAALSWVRFPQERVAPLFLRVAVTVCAAFLIFVMFLGGSRGLMATYLAGPAAIWILFGKKSVGRVGYLVVTACLFLSLIGVWEYQKRNRTYLLNDVKGVEDIIAGTSFDPTKTHRDNNLYIFTLNHMYRPDPFPFEGFYDFYVLAVNPIPRAVWPDKPKGIQENSITFSTPTGPESMGPRALGTASLSRTIVGDGFRMYHYFGVVLYAVLFGLTASFWDSFGQRRYLSSKLYFIIHASWIFWILWGYRAGFAFVTGMYSVWGAYALCYVVGMFGRRLRPPDSHRTDAPRRGITAAPFRILRDATAPNNR
jgi:hypothetical protein